MAELIYGRNTVLEALRADEALEEIQLAEGIAPRGPVGEIARRAREADVPVKWMPRRVLDEAVAGVAGPGNHQGVVAVLAAYRYVDLAQILARAIRDDEPPFLLVLDELQDVGNVGSLARTAEAAGVHGMVLAPRRAAGITAAVRKVAAGALAHLPVARMDIPEALDTLRGRDIPIVGLDEDGPHRYTEPDLGGPLAIVVGGEGRGLRLSVSGRCHALVRLPMRGRVSSLNAAVAGAIVMYEALRQREVGGRR